MTSNVSLNCASSILIYWSVSFLAIRYTASKTSPGLPIAVIDVLAARLGWNCLNARLLINAISNFSTLEILGRKCRKSFQIRTCTLHNITQNGNPKYNISCLVKIESIQIQFCFIPGTLLYQPQPLVCLHQLCPHYRTIRSSALYVNWL